MIVRVPLWAVYSFSFLYGYFLAATIRDVVKQLGTPVAAEVASDEQCFEDDP